ncbi:MAG: 23S rRNA (uracil(1939)-C(5))-methyltransferase RlmD [Lachnospiraceae bacterium]
MEEKKTKNEQNLKICPAAKKCGGCEFQGVAYKEQLKKKKRQVSRLLKPYCEVKGILGMDNPYEYRNKVHAVFGRLRNGTVISGTYEANSHRIVNIDSCMIENQKADAIIRSIRELARSFKIKIYDEDTGCGMLRHVLIRVGHHSGQIMVVLVMASPIMPSKNNFVKALLKLHPEITTIVLNVNEKRTSMILGDKEKAIYGKGYIEDTLCGLTFRISPKSFYQINTEQTEALYEKAIQLADLKGKERVLDAYCGIGTIGMAASKHAGAVIGVELNPDVVKDAVANAKANGVKNIRFYQNDAGKFMVQMAAQESGRNAVDVVFMDPPRSGSDEAFMSSVVKLGPKKVVYVSCNPETLARDLGYFTKHGYGAKEAWAVDMFPWTVHVETVVLLSHKKPDGHINVKVEFGEGEGKVPLDNIAKRAESYKPKERVTYKMIKEYIEAKYGFKVHTAYIAEVKRDLGLPMYDAPNAVEELKQPRKHPTAEKVEAIKDALKHFEVI